MKAKYLMPFLIGFMAFITSCGLEKAITPPSLAGAEVCGCYENAIEEESTASLLKCSQLAGDYEDIYAAMASESDSSKLETFRSLTILCIISGELLADRDDDEGDN